MTNGDRIPGLQITDTLLLKRLCEVSLDTGEPFLGPDRVVQSAAALGIADTDTLDSLAILEDRWLVELTWFGGSAFPGVSISTRGIENYGRRFIPGFNELLDRTLLLAAGDTRILLGDIAKDLELSPFYTSRILKILQERKLVDLTEYLFGYENGDVRVTAQGRRRAAEIRERATAPSGEANPTERHAAHSTVRDLALTGAYEKQLCAALEDAFTGPWLEQVVSFHLNMKLESITSAYNLRDRIFQLVTWAKQTGNVRNLIDGALMENPTNPQLQAFAASIRDRNAK